MTCCINPNCPNFSMPVNQSTCPDCGLELLLQGRYRAIQRLGNGSFGQVFEVEDMRGATRDRGGARKVLKVLSTDYPLAVCLFQREARVLSELKHLGIPKVEPDGYFKLCPQNSKEPLHCLVMEKIEGINLQDWLSSRNNQPLTQKQAIAWLKQLAEILQQVHQRNYFHRDIKPSNIMLKPDGQLVLIDFGAVREVTQTYIRRKDGKGGTAIISPGYTPPEQADGRAVFTSDFYALGRTFVHLLTGIHPHDIHQCPQTDRLYWRNRVPQINQELADLIDRLMAPLSANRPRNAQEILQYLEGIEIKIKSRSCTFNHNTLTKIYTKVINLSKNVYTKIFTLLNNGIRKQFVFVGLVLLTIIVIYLYNYYNFNLINPVSTYFSTDYIDYFEQHIAALERPRACDSNQDDYLSCGEKVLVLDSGGEYKQEGVKKFANGNYDEAVMLLKKARREYPSDPETLIYLNNAELAWQKANTYTIAVVAPIKDANTTDMALEILRGVAQAQDDINQQGGINGIGLRVLIATDGNEGNEARIIAKNLVAKDDILGVVGHYASEVTLSAVDIYQKNNLVLISPGSTSEQLSDRENIDNNVFFRTIPNTEVAAKDLTKYLIEEAGQKRAAIFYVKQDTSLNIPPGSSFSESLRRQFSKSFSDKGGKVVAESKLSDYRFVDNTNTVLNEIKKQKVTALAVFPDGGTTTYGISNALKLVKANQGHYWIVGSNTLYSRATLQELGEDALDRFVVAVAWHSLDSNGDSKFLQLAEDLWGDSWIEDISWRTAMAYDATQALIVALEKQPSPSRESVRQTLADRNFQAQGATGIISFKGGDRKESFSTLVKVVRSNCSPNSYTFVPVDYKDAGQDCNAESTTS
jgi:eukaryotic-like serine/threonine-protein kinase